MLIREYLGDLPLHNRCSEEHRHHTRRRKEDRILCWCNSRFSPVLIEYTYSRLLQESIFFLAECLTVYYWGRLSDIHGRRKVLLLGPLGLTAAMLGFGLSKEFAALVIFRAFQGIFNGNIGVSKTVMAEVCLFFSCVAHYHRHRILDYRLYEYGGCFHSDTNHVESWIEYRVRTVFCTQTCPSNDHAQTRTGRYFSQPCHTMAPDLRKA